MNLVKGLEALALAFLISVALGPLTIPLLRRLRWGQIVRSDGPQGHLLKTGTPTMGGIIILPALTLAAVLLGGLDIRLVILVIITWGFGLVGLADDLLKVVLRRSLGLKARQKILAQVALGLALGVAAVGLAGRSPSLTVPLLGDRWFIGWWYLPFVVVVALGSSNGVNLADGLDGLAAGTVFVAALAYLLVGVMQGQVALAIFAGALAGACLGFLVFNHHPARVFMGDTGSLALGAALAGLAVLSGTELLLPLLGGVYVLETLSVVIQVASYRLTGRRLLRMSPLHHHFELLGWAEQKVVYSFWLTSLVLAVLGVLSLYNFRLGVE